MNNCVFIFNWNEGRLWTLFDNLFIFCFTTLSPVHQYPGLVQTSPLPPAALSDLFLYCLSNIVTNGFLNDQEPGPGYRQAEYTRHSWQWYFYKSFVPSLLTMHRLKRNAIQRPCVSSQRCITANHWDINGFQNNICPACTTTQQNSRCLLSSVYPNKECNNSQLFFITFWGNFCKFWSFIQVWH